MNILVVDNNDIMLSFMQESLSANGRHTVQTASSSLEALHILDTFTPEIIFVDLIMPEIDGERFIHIVRRRKKLKDVFIVIISAIAAEDAEGRYDDIADAYIAKMPFRIMKDYLQQLLKDIENKDVEKYRKCITGLEKIYKREITAELLYSKQHLDIILSRMSDGIVELNSDGKIIYANEAAQSLFAEKETSLLGAKFIGFFPPNDGTDIKSILNDVQNNQDREHEILPIQYKDRNLTLQFIPIQYEHYSSILLVIEDVTEKKEADAIKKLLRDKEILTREVQHRVKNNLQLIISLLNLQETELTPHNFERLFQESKNRIIAMSIVHESLFETTNLEEIDFEGYLHKLVDHILYVGDHRNHPNLSLSIDAEMIKVPLNLAIPLGLIANEVFTNALIHGIHGRKDGVIQIYVRKCGDSVYEMKIADNGPGFPDDFSTDSVNSIGMLMVAKLVGQVGGKLKIENREGAAVSVVFSI